MKKASGIILFFLIIAQVIVANDGSAKYTTALQMSYRASVLGGNFMSGGCADTWKYADMPLITGAELAVEFSPQWESLQHWNNASLGVAVDYLNLTNNDKLGQTIGAYAYMNIPLVRLKHWELGLRPGIGVAFCTKTYYNTVNQEDMYKPGMNAYPANYAIGSVTNAYFAEALYMNFPIRDGWSITASYAWHHISNGSMRQPNSGYNMFLGQLGVAYQPVEHSEYSETSENSEKSKNYDIELSMAAGGRQAYYADGGQSFYAGSVSVAAHWIACPIFKLGGGVDLFYDGYYQSVTVGANRTSKFSKTYLTEPQLENCFRLGVSLQPEFIIGKFTAGFHFGVYLYDPIKNLEPYTVVQENNDSQLSTINYQPNKGIFYKYDILNAGEKEDGWLYTRIVLKYRITNHLFVQAGLKAHLMKAEFMDAGLGACF